MRVQSFCLLVLLALLAWAKPVRAAESYDNCTGFIASLPAVISTQGTWCFNKDLNTAVTSGQAITISTNNVTIDCNNFKLGGLAAGLGTQATGIYASDHFNATVRHCSIRGFFYGIWLRGTTGSSTGGHAVEDNRLDGNTYTGLVVEGDGSVVRRNRVFDTGGSTAGFPGAYAIAAGYSVDILDNTVSGALATSGSNGNAWGIVTSYLSDGSSVNGNRVRGLLKDGTGTAHGIHIGNVGHVNLRSNDLIGDASVNSFGVYCTGVEDRLKDNLIGHFEGAYAFCGDAGGNDITP